MSVARQMIPAAAMSCAVLAGAVGSLGTPALADDAAPAAALSPQRPAILFNRWQEDWSVLANPDVPREPFDALKYIPLSSADPKSYLSFGADLRERFESNDAAGFGTSNSRADSYDISRMEAHANLRVAEQ